MKTCKSTKTCRLCDKAIREKNPELYRKRLGLCAKCYAWDKKRVKQGIKYSNVEKTLLKKRA